MSDRVGRLLAAKLFRGDVGRGPDDHPGRGPPPVGRILRTDRAREAEVEDLHDAARRDHQVLGLQVPVNEAGLVGVGHALGRLHRDVHRPRERQPPVLKERTDGAAVHVLHDDVGTRGALADLVDRQDVRVTERGRRLRLG